MKRETRGRSGSSDAVVRLCRGAVVAALYAALTYATFFSASGVIQFRIAEALCILPIFMPEAIGGLFVGCIISNLLSGSVWDIIFGSIATLIGAIGAYLLRSLPDKLLWLATLPTIVSNAVIVPFVLMYAYGAEEAYGFMLCTVGIGEVVCAGIGGCVLLYALRRAKFLTRR